MPKRHQKRDKNPADSPQTLHFCAKIKKCATESADFSLFSWQIWKIIIILHHKLSKTYNYVRN